MIEQLETDLRDALAQRAGEVPAHANTRLRRIDYHPRSHRVPTGVALGALAVVAGTAGVILSIAGLGAGTQRAFAGWTASPTLPVSGQTAAAEAACLARMPTSAKIERARARAGAVGPHLPHRPFPTVVAGGWRVVLTDTRGPFTMVILETANGRGQASCFSGPSSSEETFVGGGFGGQPAPVPAGQVRATSFGGATTPSTRKGQFYMRVIGRTGSGVTGVVLVLGDGTHVEATNANRRFLAWWPGSRQAVAVEVTTASGTSMQRLPTPLHRLMRSMKR